MRRPCMWLGIVVLVCISWGSGAYAAEEISVFDFPGNKRVTELRFDKGIQIGSPAVEGDLIIWSEQIGNYNYPCYFRIGENVSYRLSTSTKNGEPVQVSNGVIVYRTNNGLGLTNLSREEQFGLGPGENLEITGQNVQDIYQINNGKVVYQVGGTSVSTIFYLLTDNSLQPKQLFKGYANSLRLSEHEGQTLMLWSKENKLYYCNLDEIDVEGNHFMNELKDSQCKNSNISTYGNEVVYFGNDNQLYRQKIAVNSTPELVPVEAQYGAICLINQQIYFLDKSNNICLYDFNNGQIKQIENLLPALSIASNGNDMVCKSKDYKVCWYAGVSDLAIEKTLDKVKAGEEFGLEALATYNNGYQEDITLLGKWSSDNEGVITVENGICQALAPGEARIMVEYEGQSVCVDILVKEVLGLQLTPGKTKLDQGEEIWFSAYLLYSDGEMIEITDQVTWSSVINEIIKGLYKAHHAGTDTITISYEAWTASINITVKALDENLPEEPGPVPEPEPNPGPDPEPIPTPNPGSKPGSSKAPKAEIKENEKSEDIPVWTMKFLQNNQLKMKRGWQERGILYSTLMMPYQLWPIMDLFWDRMPARV